jgi:hypothetical protein
MTSNKTINFNINKIANCIYLKKRKRNRKMLHKIIIIFIILSFESILCLDSKDLCFSINSECNEIQSYKCTNDLCTIDKKTCFNYFNNFKQSQAFRSLNYLALKNIKTCDYTKKEAKRENYCLKNLECFNRESTNKWRRRVGYIQILKIFNNYEKCTCKGMFPYECGTSCTLNEKHCDLIKSKNHNETIENKYCN